MHKSGHLPTKTKVKPKPPRCTTPKRGIRTNPKKPTRTKTWRTPPLTPSQPFTAQSRLLTTQSPANDDTATDTAPIVATITTDPKSNVFTSLPPVPQKSAEEEKIPDLPNFINSEYNNGRKSIMSMTLDELTTAIHQLGLPKFRAKQIFNWVYKSGVSDWSEMRNMPKRELDILQQNYFIYPIDLKYVATASDATRKYIFQIEKKGKKIDTIESVFIPRIWDRLYGQDETTPLDQWDIPAPSGGPNGADNDDDDEDAAVGGVSYDVSTFLNYRNAYLTKMGQLGDHNAELSALNIIPNSTLAGSAEALANSASSIANGQQQSQSKQQQLSPRTMTKGHLFIPDFLQSHPDQQRPLHPFDSPLYQYEKGAVCFPRKLVVV